MREPGLRLTATSAAETRALGRRLAAAMLAARVPGPLFIGLSGELGAGKTTFVAGLLEALGHAGPVRSPTYTLVEPYVLEGHEIDHCDLYRLRDPVEVDELGLRDSRDGRHWLLVEWPERAADRLGTPDLDVRLGYDAAGRAVALEPHSEAGRTILARFDLEPA